MSASSEVVSQLTRSGPRLERDVIAAIGGGPRAETGVFVAVLSGEVERVALLDGAHELRLKGGAA